MSTRIKISEKQNSIRSSGVTGGSQVWRSQNNWSGRPIATAGVVVAIVTQLIVRVGPTVSGWTVTARAALSTAELQCSFVLHLSLLLDIFGFQFVCFSHCDVLCCNMIVICIFISLTIISAVNYFKTRRKRALITNLSGPLALPLIGSVQMFLLLTPRSEFCVVFGSKSGFVLTKLRS